MSEKLSVLLAGSATVEFGTTHLPRYLSSDWQINTWTKQDGPEHLQQLVHNADAMISEGFGRHVLDAPKLKLFHVPFAGYDWLQRELLPTDCIVCNAYEHEIPIAEYVMLAILEWQFRLHEIDSDFRSGSWRYCMPVKGPYHGEAYGKTVGLIGYGHIGKEIAKRTTAFGMRTIAIAPTPRPKPNPLDWLGVSNSDLDRLLSESDYVVVTCPLNEQTRDLINTAQFNTMKQSAVLINVARGKVVNEAALYNALHTKTIAGAFIDTWYQYPFEYGHDENSPPANHPFHELDNIYMTPHCSAWTKELIERRWRFVAANLDRLANNQPLQNIVSFD